MTDLLPSPSTQVTCIRRAHAETDQGLAFAALVDRLVAREAERDGVTGLTAAEAASEWAHRRDGVRRLRVESPHNPLLAVDRPAAPGGR